MSTADVTKLLGVSRRTLMRWVQQLDMQLEKNELGHYQFSNEDVERLKQIQSQSQPPQTQSQPVSQAVQTVQGSRKGTLKNVEVVENPLEESLIKRMEELERALRSKADDVVSYQMLQHRREIEELTKKIALLEQKIEDLENAQSKREPKDHSLVFDQSTTQKKPRRKNLISSIFSF
ncbi:MerR family transcriptional regulator [Metabacillus sediminilitoris]|uniref:Chromosome-anchoring protein RacA n=2 Tax=Metabacillus sediminilitoris TaxID=2567941 RepID=A0A4S4BQ23_9BACI|nr:MerR family transcriptional regulator [Metabacillus sediminilitoris]QGQ48360.1 MerR family transcriptional regulator [Metabacillus sediminilitoris]THF77016.1 MerR family transcriptional regulator [Metabacillus sediminilitoris]